MYPSAEKRKIMTHYNTMPRLAPVPDSPTSLRGLPLTSSGPDLVTDLLADPTKLKYDTVREQSVNSQ
jgi:hypothetical protein